MGGIFCSYGVYNVVTVVESECERQHLLENVYIKLKEYCRAAHGTEFQV